MTTQIKAGVIAANAVNSSELASGALSGQNFTGDVTFDTTTLKIDSSNNRVGIGTDSPSTKLHIAGPTSSHTTLRIQSTSTGYDPTIVFSSPTNGSGIYLDDNDTNKLKFYTGYGKGVAGKEITIDNEAQLGIGTTSPKTTLNVAANNSGQGPILTLENSDTSLTTNDVLGQIDFYGNDGSTGGTGQKATIKAIALNSSGTSVGLAFGTSAFPNTTATEYMRIDSSGSLLVNSTSAGINRLKVVGDASRYGILSENLSGYGAFNLKSTTVAQTWSIGAVDNSSNSDLFIYGGSSAGTKVTLDSSGNVGITAAASLRFNGAGDESHAVGYDSTVDGSFIRGQNGIRILTGTGGGTERMRIDSAGTMILRADGAANLGRIQFSSQASTYQILGGNNIGYMGYKTGGYHRFFGSDGVEDMRIDSSGRLLVGNTGLTSCKTSIYNSGVDALRIALSDNAASGTSFIACFSDSTTTAYGNLRLNIVASGNVTNSNNSYGGISDEKLKENIVDATDKLEDLKQVRIRNYNFIGEDKKQIGVIAQELVTIFPNMVEETPDLDDDNNDLGTTTKSVKYSVFVPILIKAIQEQQTIIDDLKSRITKLEG